MSMKRLATITVATMTMGLALAARGDTTAKSPALTNPAEIWGFL